MTPPTSAQSSGTNSSSISRMPEVVEFLTDHVISTKESLQDPTSPQFKAALWMADIDILEYKIPLSATDKTSRFIQHYAMVVLCSTYTLNGQAWKSQFNFLPQMDECKFLDINRNEISRIFSNDFSKMTLSHMYNNDNTKMEDICIFFVLFYF